MRNAVVEVARRMAKLKSNEGSAFVISILILFVLTVLGLALMLTTSTEKDIAINYRWGEQAFFNADAALEYGKNVLASYALLNANFTAILPPFRSSGNTTVPYGATWGPAHPEPLACTPSTPGCRDYQYFVDQCPGGAVQPCTRVYIRRCGTFAIQWAPPAISTTTAPRTSRARTRCGFVGRWSGTATTATRPRAKSTDA
jgi:hypothetical protein